jgi:polyphosphate glucokinase
MRGSGRSRRGRSTASGPRTLAIDVGGTAIKAVVLDGEGSPVATPVRVPTPRPATPEAMLDAVVAIAEDLRPFDRVAVGFPGALRRGRVETAPNLDEDAWRGADLAAVFTRRLHRPVRVGNDAVVQGLAAIRGEGVELVVTLGTGVGSALFVDGRPVPLEIGHLPWREGRSYEERLGEAARRRIGGRRWRVRVRAALEIFRAALRPDVLYVGGGNSARLGRAFAGVARPVDNVAGLLGGFHLWEGTRRADRARS